MRSSLKTAVVAALVVSVMAFMNTTSAQQTTPAQGAQASTVEPSWETHCGDGENVWVEIGTYSYSIPQTLMCTRYTGTCVHGLTTDPPYAPVQWNIEPAWLRELVSDALLIPHANAALRCNPGWGLAAGEPRSAIVWTAVCSGPFSCRDFDRRSNAHDQQRHRRNTHDQATFLD